MGIVSGGGGGTFNGGTITGGLTVHPSTDAQLLDLIANAAQNADIATVENVNGAQIFRLDAFDDFRFDLSNQGGDFRIIGAGGNNMSVLSSGISTQAAATKFAQITCATHGSAYVDASGVALRDGSDNTKVLVDGTGVGFFGHATAAKPTVAGAKLPSDVVLASLLTALAGLGLLTDNST